LWGGRANHYLPLAFRQHPHQGAAHALVVLIHQALGTRGVGEGTPGSVPGALGSVPGAVSDALSPFGIEVNEPPIRPHKLWREIQKAKARQAAD